MLLNRVDQPQEDEQVDGQVHGHEEVRRSSLYLHRINPRTAIAVGATFNAILGVTFALAGYAVITVASSHGVLDQVNTVTSDLGTGHVQRLSAARLCFIWTAIVVGWVVVATLLIALVTVIFNCLLRLMGGLELDLDGTRGERPDLRSSTRQLVTSIAASLQERAPQPAGPAESPTPVTNPEQPALRSRSTSRS